MRLRERRRAHPSRPAARGTHELSAGAVVDMLALSVLLGVGAMAYGPVFEGLSGYRAAGGGLQIGLVVALVSAWRGWSGWLTASVAAGAFLLLGGLFALPQDAVAGVFTGPGTGRRLLSLSWSVWAELPTLSVPVPEESGAGVLPYLAGTVCALAAGTLALRGRRPLLAMVPVLAFVASGIMWGTDEASWAVGQGLVLGVVGLGWASWRSGRGRTQPGAGAVRWSGPRPVWAGLAVLALAAGAAGAGAVALSGVTQRQVLRDAAVPQLDVGAYPSPLLRYRHFAQGLRTETLLTVRGLPRAGRLRVATLESYDGFAYEQAGGAGYVELDGEDVEPAGEGDGAEPTTVQVTVGKYDGVWVPGGGDLRRITFEGPRAGLLAESAHYDATTGNVLATAGLEEGDGYRVQLVLPRGSASLEDLDGVGTADLRLPPVLRVPTVVRERAVEFAGEESDPALRIARIAETLRYWGFFSDGSDGRSQPGHSAPRMQRLLADPVLVGDDEQFAVVTALMARTLGIPARVVLGFHRDARLAGARGGEREVELTGADLRVWTEVAFEGQGWVPVEATPGRDKTLPAEAPGGKRRDREPQDPEPDATTDDAAAEEDEAERASRPSLWWVLVPVAVVLPGASLAAAKALRRRRRRSRGDVLRRLGGAWEEVLDTATDVGSPLPASRTRHEAAQSLAARHPAAVLVPLADEVDAWVFGPAEPSEEDVALVWAASDAARAEVRRGVTRPRRWWALLSPASLRRRG